MKKNILKIFYSLGGLVLMAIPGLASADLGTDIKNKLNPFAGTAGYTTSGDVTTLDLANRIGGVVKILLAFLGIIFLILIIASGFKWMTTSNPDEIKKIRAKMLNAVIGLAIILASYTITFFILTQLSAQGLITTTPLAQ